MHPLWYSSIIPFLFIISCVAAGLAMTIFESFISSRAFGREVELPLLSDLAKVVVVVLALYFTVRVQDLMSRDALGYVFQWSYQSAMFMVEIVLGVILPFALLLFRKVRASKTGLFYSATLVLLGFVAHRVNTAVTSMESWPERVYVPSVQEVSITMGSSPSDSWPSVSWPATSASSAKNPMTPLPPTGRSRAPLPPSSPRASSSRSSRRASKARNFPRLFFVQLCNTPS